MMTHPNPKAREHAIQNAQSAIAYTREAARAGT